MASTQDSVRFSSCCLFCCNDKSELLMKIHHGSTPASASSSIRNSHSNAPLFVLYIYSRSWTSYYWSCFNHGDTTRCNINCDEKDDRPDLLQKNWSRMPHAVAYSRLETATAPLSYCQTATRARRRLHSIYCSLIKLLAHQRSSTQQQQQQQQQQL